MSAGEVMTISHYRAFIARGGVTLRRRTLLQPALPARCLTAVAHLLHSVDTPVLCAGARRPAIDRVICADIGT